MTIFIIILFLFILLILYMNAETRMLEITRHTFKKRSCSKGGKLTCLHFTDLHLGRTGIKKNRILKTVKDNPTDFLLFTGDYFESDKQIPLFTDLIEELRKIYRNPIFLCFGNHDRKDVFSRFPGTFDYIINFLKEHNITVLENTYADYISKNGNLRIIGISDARSNEADIAEIIKSSRSENSANLLITHNSDVLIKAENASVDFAVAGHTHGAQVRSPFNIEIKLLHRKDILSSRKNIVRGYHRYKDIDLYITRGLGCSELPVRFLSRPEVLILTIEI